MQQESNQSRTVLVVDDFEEMRSTLRLWLEKRGYAVVEAEDGEKAIAVARETRPTLILMDIGMPERSGISAAYKIRADPELKHIPIVAVTAYDAEDLHEFALKAGCLACLTKPVDSDQLEKILSDLF